MVISLLKNGIRKSSIVLALVLFSTVTWSKCIQLDWTAPTEREDETAIQAIEKYNLYYTNQDSVLSIVEIDGAAITYSTCSIQTGTHIFQLATVEDSQEGEKSDLLSITWTGNAPPKKMIITGNNMTIQLIDE